MTPDLTYERNRPGTSLEDQRQGSWALERSFWVLESKPEGPEGSARGKDVGGSSGEDDFGLGRYEMNMPGTGLEGHGQRIWALGSKAGEKGLRGGFQGGSQGGSQGRVLGGRILGFIPIGACRDRPEAVWPGHLGTWRSTRRSRRRALGEGFWAQFGRSMTADCTGLRGTRLRPA